MGPKLERVRTHLRENKDRWICAGIGLGVGVGATAVYLLKRTSEQTLIVETAEMVNQAGRDIHNTNITINEDPVKRLSYIIRWGKDYFETQREAAEALGVSEVKLSRFLNGKEPHLGKDLDEVPVRVGTRGES